MEYSSIQFGFDIATSISIIVAAFSFMWNSMRQRTFTIRKQRIVQMSKIVSDFADILDRGHIIIEDIQRGKSKDGDVLGGFCASVIRYNKINNTLLFEVWAKDDEKKIIDDISKLVYSWNSAYVDAHNNNRDVPNFPTLLEGISSKIKELSTKVRKEIEEI